MASPGDDSQHKRTFSLSDSFHSAASQALTSSCPSPEPSAVPPRFTPSPSETAQKLEDSCLDDPFAHDQIDVAQGSSGGSQQDAYGNENRGNVVVEFIQTSSTTEDASKDFSFDEQSSQAATAADGMKAISSRLVNSGESDAVNPS